jgi:UDP-N-acetylmuramate: L-alanyl-gamma-D-glutamyl-meso-diaminopimelate ligase
MACLQVMQANVESPAMHIHILGICGTFMGAWPPWHEKPVTR